MNIIDHYKLYKYFIDMNKIILKQVYRGNDKTNIIKIVNIFFILSFISYGVNKIDLAKC